MIEIQTFLEKSSNPGKRYYEYLTLNADIQRVSHHMIGRTNTIIRVSKMIVSGLVKTGTRWTPDECVDVKLSE